MKKNEITIIKKEGIIIEEEGYYIISMMHNRKGVKMRT